MVVEKDCSPRQHSSHKAAGQPGLGQDLSCTLQLVVPIAWDPSTPSSSRGTALEPAVGHPPSLLWTPSPSGHQIRLVAETYPRAGETLWKATGGVTAAGGKR